MLAVVKNYWGGGFEPNGLWEFTPMLSIIGEHVVGLILLVTRKR